ncbi:MAG: hypothetical protein ACRC0L_00585 [Angustibacter sp.]
MTVTRTRTITPVPTSSEASPTSQTLGRRFDLGTIVNTRKIDDTTWVELDRWTKPGISDGELARTGVPLGAHYGSPYINLSTEKRYWAPVATDALVVWNECIAREVPGPPGLSSAPLPAGDWLENPDRLEVFLLSYSNYGVITRFDSEASCPLDSQPASPLAQPPTVSESPTAPEPPSQTP